MHVTDSGSLVKPYLVCYINEKNTFSSNLHFALSLNIFLLVYHKLHTCIMTYNSKHQYSTGIRKKALRLILNSSLIWPLFLSIAMFVFRLSFGLCSCHHRYLYFSLHLGFVTIIIDICISSPIWSLFLSSAISVFRLPFGLYSCHYRYLYFVSHLAFVLSLSISVFRLTFRLCSYHLRYLYFVSHLAFVPIIIDICISPCIWPLFLSLWISVIRLSFGLFFFFFFFVSSKLLYFVSHLAIISVTVDFCISSPIWPLFLSLSLSVFRLSFGLCQYLQQSLYFVSHLAFFLSLWISVIRLSFGLCLYHQQLLYFVSHLAFVSVTIDFCILSPVWPLFLSSSISVFLLPFWPLFLSRSISVFCHPCSLCFYRVQFLSFASHFGLCFYHYLYLYFLSIVSCRKVFIYEKYRNRL